MKGVRPTRPRVPQGASTTQVQAYPARVLHRKVEIGDRIGGRSLREGDSRRVECTFCNGVSQTPPTCEPVKSRMANG